ncbi:MAG: nucleotide exchange factor GrpE [Thermodesulfobacteriota bacterium]|nr:nucleotide exchange factor GrpE [Thermodesulfobacteriota bacterium]
MGQISAVKEKTTEQDIVEDLQGELEENLQDKGEAEARKEKEVPLEKMTKAQLLDKIEEIQKSAEDNFDQYLRSQAEMENIKKRFQKEKEGLIKYSNESLIKQLLHVIDSLEKAIAHSQDENSVDALREGLELTLKGLLDTLKKAGVEKVEALGETFDPNYHEAVLEQEDENLEPGKIVQEFQKGYVLNNRLIRPAMVIVSK